MVVHGHEHIHDRLHLRLLAMVCQKRNEGSWNTILTSGQISPATMGNLRHIRGFPFPGNHNVVSSIGPVCQTETLKVSISENL